jgi:ATP-dependent Clp protease ATP-binding subunit ClpX
METMYKVPSEESLSKVVLDGAVVRGETEPLMVYEKTSKTKTG